MNIKVVQQVLVQVYHLQGAQLVISLIDSDHCIGVK
jgi:hypothetical protein